MSLISCATQDRKREMEKFPWKIKQVVSKKKASSLAPGIFESLHIYMAKIGAFNFLYLTFLPTSPHVFPCLKELVTQYMEEP